MPKKFTKEKIREILLVGLTRLNDYELKPHRESYLVINKTPAEGSKYNDSNPSVTFFDHNAYSHSRNYRVYVLEGVEEPIYHPSLGCWGGFDGEVAGIVGIGVLSNLPPYNDEDKTKHYAWCNWLLKSPQYGNFILNSSGEEIAELGLMVDSRTPSNTLFSCLLLRKTFKNSEITRTWNALVKAGVHPDLATPIVGAYCGGRVTRGSRGEPENMGLSIGAIHKDSISNYLKGKPRTTAEDYSTSGAYRGGQDDNLIRSFSISRRHTIEVAEDLYNFLVKHLGVDMNTPLVADGVPKLVAQWSRETHPQAYK